MQNMWLQAASAHWSVLLSFGHASDLQVVTMARSFIFARHFNELHLKAKSIRVLI